MLYYLLIEGRKYYFFENEEDMKSGDLSKVTYRGYFRKDGYPEFVLVLGENEISSFTCYFHKTITEVIFDTDLTSYDKETRKNSGYNKFIRYRLFGDQSFKCIAELGSDLHEFLKEVR